MTLTSIIGQITNLVSASVLVLLALALFFFLWGLAQWILNMADTEKHKEGKQRMIWGLVALFVIISIGGLVGILQGTFFPFTSPHSDVTTTDLGVLERNPIDSGGSLEDFDIAGVGDHSTAEPTDGAFRLVGSGPPAPAGSEGSIETGGFFNFCFLGLGNRCPHSFLRF